MNDKIQWRSELKTRLAAISPKKREEGASKLLSLPLSSTGDILSFASFRDEIDTRRLNHYLARTNRLLLPKIDGEELKIFRVNHLEEQLKPNKWGLYEPSSTLCEEINYSRIQTVLVPALGFDTKNHRLGYGKGYYDRFLAQITFCPTIGIGFKEQLVDSLPVEETDVALTAVALF
ncbi:MAG: 5-formyltetrahydrofolate cyclo-ligase [Chlamydiales bacterium]